MSKLVFNGKQLHELTDGELRAALDTVREASRRFRASIGPTMEGYIDDKIELLDEVDKRLRRFDA